MRIFRAFFAGFAGMIIGILTALDEKEDTA